MSMSKPATKGPISSRSLRAAKSDPSSPTLPKRRRVSNLPGSGSKADPVWDEGGSFESVFPGLTGAALIEKIFDTYGDPRGEYLDLPWFQDDGRETVLADPFNRPLQQSTVAEYEQRLFDSGLASDCSGPEWAGHILNSMECVTVSVFDLLDVNASE